MRDVAAAGKAATKDSSQEMLERLTGQGLVGLGYVFPGQRHVISTSPINSIQDLKNRKIRTFPNEIFKVWWEELGAAPTGIALAQVATEPPVFINHTKLF